MAEDQEMSSLSGALSCHQKGANWVAILKIGEGEEAIDLEIGSINIHAMMESENLRKEFIALMRKTVLHIIQHNDIEAKVTFESKEIAKQ